MPSRLATARLQAILASIAAGVRDLSDADYVYVLEEIERYCSEYSEAKRYEQKVGGTD